MIYFFRLSGQKNVHIRKFGRAHISARKISSIIKNLSVIGLVGRYLRWTIERTLLI
jgi:hypothetical protein